MADQQDRRGNPLGTKNPADEDLRQQIDEMAGTSRDDAARQRERDQQNKDDPSRAPESGDQD